MTIAEIGGLNILHLSKILLLKFVLEKHLYCFSLTLYLSTYTLLVSQENQKLAYGNTNGILPIQIEPTKMDVKPLKKSTKASRLVAKLSPKKCQRKREIIKIATMKVQTDEIFVINLITIDESKYIAKYFGHI